MCCVYGLRSLILRILHHQFINDGLYSRTIDLFAEMDKKHLRIRDQIRNEFFRVKELLGKRPSRMDLFTYMDDDVYQMAVTHSNENPFKKYLNYLEELDELTDEQKKSVFTVFAYDK